MPIPISYPVDEIPLMKPAVVILLVCLLVTGMASATSVSQPAVGAQKVVVPTQSPAVKATAGIHVAPVTSYAPMEVFRVQINTVPSGATVMFDPDSTPPGPSGTSPATVTLSRGYHTVDISLDRYQDASYMFLVNSSVNVTITLKPLITHTVLQPVTPVPAFTMQPGHVITLASRASAGQYIPGQAGQPGAPATLEYIPGEMTLVTPVPGTTMTYVDCPPDSDWICMTPAEAQQRFGTYARLGDTPCGLEENYGSPLAAIKFCYSEAPSMSLPSGALTATGIREGEDIYIMNKTWIEHAVVNISPATGQEGSGGGNAGPLQPIFDFFSSLFGGGVPKPSAHLELVELNPCPEPPMTEAGRLK
jgi:hypothetical protein